jgi:hypothetical protein
MAVMRWTAVVLFLLSCGPGYAQNAVRDVLAGKLVNPEVGVWAWYEIEDPGSEEKVQLRQAITGEERVKRKTGYWVETQIRPQTGFSVVYKMLLTGPATEPGNVHAVFYQTGTELPLEVPLDEFEMEGTAPDTESLTPVGEVAMPTPQGSIVCQHYKLADGTEVWISDALPPLGIVRLQSSKGNMVLQSFGKGGPEAESRLRVPGEVASEPGADAPDGDAPDAAPVDTEASKDDAERAPVRRNFGGRLR